MNLCDQLQAYSVFVIFFLIWYIFQQQYDSCGCIPFYADDKPWDDNPRNGRHPGSSRYTGGIQHSLIRFPEIIHTVAPWELWHEWCQRLHPYASIGFWLDMTGAPLRLAVRQPCGCWWPRNMLPKVSFKSNMWLWYEWCDVYWHFRHFFQLLLEVGTLWSENWVDLQLRAALIAAAAARPLRNDPPDVHMTCWDDIFCFWVSWLETTAFPLLVDVGRINSGWTIHQLWIGSSIRSIL